MKRVPKNRNWGVAGAGPQKNSKSGWVGPGTLKKGETVLGNVTMNYPHFTILVTLIDHTLNSWSTNGDHYCIL